LILLLCLIATLALTACAAIIEPTPAPTLAPTLTATVPPTPTATAAMIAPDQLAQWARRFDGQVALRHVNVLASPEYAGRRAGTVGADKAAEYVATRFKDAGLKPVGDGNTYFQEFSLPYLDLADLSLALLDDKGQPKITYRHRADFAEVFNPRAGEGEASGPVVLVGLNQDGTLPKADVKGKIVLLLRGRARTNLAQNIDAVVSQDAAGVLFVVQDDSTLRFKSSYLVEAAPSGQVPVLIISQKAANDVLQGSGSTFQELREKVLSQGGLAVPLGTRVRMSFKMKPRQEVTTRNVLGLLPGSDPTLSNEIIMVGGHYDHVGTDPNGTLFPGANDNASGTAVVVALAEFFQQIGFVPRRSILFVAWGAEEAGIIGSTYYVAHPLFPLDKTRAFINLDVVGRGDGNAVTATGEAPKLAALIRGWGRELGLSVTSGESGGGGSDHAAFFGKGPATAHLIWAGAIDTIHVPDDTPDKIDPAKLGATGQLVALALMRLGTDATLELK